MDMGRLVVTDRNSSWRESDRKNMTTRRQGLR
jgi:hypothetical protein